LPMVRPHFRHRLGALLVIVVIAASFFSGILFEPDRVRRELESDELAERDGFSG